MTRNRLREKISSGETSYGLWVTMDSPTVTEIAVALRLDWVSVDTEHSYLDYGQLAEHVRAVRGSDTTVLVRVPGIDQSAVKRVLDIGAHGIILPLVRSPEDLQKGMSYARYPPTGVRGVGGQRAMKWGLGSDEYLSYADEEILVVPLIETPEAIQNIDAILDVPGLEAIYFGPADLSASLGYLGQWEGPGVGDMILGVRAKAAARGVAAGINARSLEDGARRQEQGFDMIAVGSDATLLIRSINEAVEQLRGPKKPCLWF